MIQDYLQASSPTLNELMPGKAKDIAKKLGLNPQSVRRILNGKDGFNEQTVEAVFEEALSNLKKQIEYYELQYEKWESLKDKKVI